jgi:hypothetical protein
MSKTQKGGFDLVVPVVPVQPFYYNVILSDYDEDDVVIKKDNKCYCECDCKNKKPHYPTKNSTTHYDFNKN